MCILCGLCGGIQPDHNTIANFRSGKLKGKFKKIFNQVIVLLASQGVLNIKDIYVDGTKIEVNANRYTLIRLKAKEKLCSPEGIKHRKQRCWDIEAIFGNMKHNMNFKRFMLRGIDNVNTEIGLIAMAHNLKKLTITS